MYDEFGNLKKKFRAKTQVEAVNVSRGAGRAGWEVEELGIAFIYFMVCFSHIVWAVFYIITTTASRQCNQHIYRTEH